MIITDKNIIDGIREKYGHRSASHSFLSLFIYGKDEGYKVTVDEDGFYAEDKDGRFLFPVGSDEYKREFIQDHTGISVYMLREEDGLFVKSVKPGFDFEDDPDRSEYVYSRAEQASLEGHKFQKVRAKLSRFYRENDVKNVPLTLDNIDDAYKILSQWTPKAGEGDAEGAKTALDNFTALSLSGMITYIDGKPVGYCCGADIGQGVYMLCSAKQISDVQGLNLSTKQELFKTLPDSIGYINTESDHGSPGIRMHKNDSRPVFLNKMYKGIL